MIVQGMEECSTENLSLSLSEDDLKHLVEFTEKHGLEDVLASSYQDACNANLPAVETEAQQFVEPGYYTQHDMQQNQSYVAQRSESHAFGLHENMQTQQRAGDGFLLSERCGGPQHLAPGFNCMTPPLDDNLPHQAVYSQHHCEVTPYPIAYDGDAQTYSLKQEPLCPEYTSCQEVAPSATKHVLKQKINMRRPGLVSVYRKPEHEALSTEDLERRQLRRERNKEAAQRCRLKKRAQIDAQLQKAKSALSENKVLKDKVTGLEQENTRLRRLIEEHKSRCSVPD